MSKQHVNLPSLDGVRAIASWMVVIAHIWGVLFVRQGFKLFINIRPLGIMGVTIFFTLSGCLITFLLMHEKEISQGINLKNFYVRRMLRIWPLYFLVVALGLIFYYRNFDWRGLLLCLFFLSNVAFTLKLYPSIIDPIWSIGVEEQFYLMHPLLIKVCKRDLLIPLFIILIFCYHGSKLFFRQYFPSLYHQYLNDIYYTARFDCMWMGAIAGVLLFYKYNKIPIRFIPFSKPIRNVAILCSIIYISLVLTGVLGFYHIILSLFIAVVLIHISIESMSLPILNTKTLKHLGTISYGVYLLHMFPLFVGLRFTQYMESNNAVLLITVAIGVAICTYLLALISYRYFERPFLDYKNKFAVVKR